MIDCLIYFAVFAIVFILNLAAMKQKKIGLKRFLILASFAVLLIFIGFRYNVGTDYASYLEDYNRAASVEWSKIPTLRTELLMSSVFKISSYVLWDARLIFVIMGFLLLYPIYKINKLYDYKYLAYSVLTFCVLFLPFGLNGMRQGIAMGFTMLSIIYFIRGNIKYGIINFVISMLFHFSALIMLPYIVAICLNRWKKINFNRMNIIITILVSVLVLFFLNNLLLENGITRYDYILGEINVEKISVTYSLFYLPILLIIIFLRDKKNHEKDSEVNILMSLIIVGLLFYLLGSAAHYLSRFAMYFMLLSIIVLPKLIQEIADKNSRILTKSAYILYLGTLFYLQYAMLGWQEILPYQTWLFGGYL